MNCTTKNKYLIVYNICEIANENSDWYISCLDNLLNTRGKFDLAVSGCMITSETKKKLLQKYKDKIIFNFIDTRLTINVTLNHSINKIREYKGNYDAYIYIDSGINVRDNIQWLEEMDIRYQTGEYEMITLQSDTDTGFSNFGVHGYFYDHDFVVPVGRGCQIHTHLYGSKIVNHYDRVIPDIFLAFCTESVFTFLVAAVESRWLIVKDLILEHKKSADGASAGFDHIGARGEPWNNLYGGLNMLDIINDPVARQLGLGYEECNQIMMHDPEKFTPKGHAKEPELKNYIRDKLFLQEHILNYKHIPFQLYYEDKFVNSN
jgi:hypothetical protein